MNLKDKKYNQEKIDRTIRLIRSSFDHIKTEEEVRALAEANIRANIEHYLVRGRE